MATWKKISVSGSNISQFNNDSGYLTSITAQHAFTTASFNGTDLLAGSSEGQLNFTSGSGGQAGILITPNAGTDTLDFSLGASSVPNTALVNSTISGKALGSNLDDLTVDDATLTLDSDTTYNGSAAKTISIKDGGVDTDAIANSLGTLGTNSFTGSFNGSFKGAVDIDLEDLTQGTGITAFTYDGNSTATVSIKNADNLTDNTLSKWDDSNGQFVNSIATDDGSTLTVTGDQLVTGDLTVQGTASFQNTTELQVADRFILMASGSETPGDGGIVIQQGTQNVGEVFGFDNNTTRFGLTGSFNATQTAFTPDAFMSAVVNTAGNDPNGANAPDARYQKKGNIYVASNSEDIWIYS